jgi:SAM-dependent methyltransferase
MASLPPTDPKQRFSDRVEHYVRSRPRYPAALIEHLRANLGLLPSHRIADVGSGTGFLSELFLANGNEVFAVEPNAPMRHAAESALQRFPGFHNIDGSAEATTLPGRSVSFITAGQAFHWFDAEAARREFIRILLSEGWVVLVWNERAIDDAFGNAFQAVIDRFEIDPAVNKSRTFSRTPEKLGPFFGRGGFGAATFPNDQFLDFQGLVDRVASSSYMPRPADPAQAALNRTLRELFDAHQSKGRVRMRYETMTYFGHLT